MFQCRFCERRTCANLTMQHPGWTHRLLSPAEAEELVDELVSQHPGERFVVGVAGPGDPLANQETFDALGRVHRAHPELTKCVSTNGLLLHEELSTLLGVGVSALTVTVNALDPEVGQMIYLYARHRGAIYRGRSASEVLISAQFVGIRAAIDADLLVKVNTVLIPGVNDHQLSSLACRLADLGVPLMNIMPLIPSGEMRGRRAPTCDELRGIRDECEAIIPQFRKCQQCRADIVCFPQ